jgi:hypothetical protein
VYDLDYDTQVRPLLVGSILALAGCATGPDVTVLCGVWASEDMRERWWIVDDGLAGEGRLVQGGDEIVTETLALRPTRGGHIYVAKPGDASPTPFAPIDPDKARFGPEPAELGPDVVRLSWANYEHDFPQEIHYLVRGDRLTAIVSSPERETGWEFQRSSPCTDPP